jgi:hypothetical protein
MTKFDRRQDFLDRIFAGTRLALMALKAARWDLERMLKEA